jgi:hypothetical protein
MGYDFLKSVITHLPLYKPKILDEWNGRRAAVALILRVKPKSGHETLKTYKTINTDHKNKEEIIDEFLNGKLYH